MSRILPSEMESYDQRCRNANAWGALSHLYSTICKDGKETDPTLMGADIHDRFKELNDELEKADADCHAEIWAVNDQRWKDLRDIYKALGCDGMNGHIDDFAKTVKERAIVIKSERDRYLKQRDTAIEDYQTLCEENQKSDVNKLIRDYCIKNNIIAPSRYFSDKACVEYLFAIIDLERKDRSFAILQDLYRYIFEKHPDGLSAEDIANKILDKVLETEDLSRKKDATMAESDWYGISPYIKKKAEEHGISMHECKSDDWRFVIGFLMGIIARMKEENGERRNPHELK